MLNSPIDEIKSRLDIIDVVQGYVKLQKTGANFRARCPFHSEKTPSFFVSPARQIFKCFGCGQGGGIFDFVMKMEGIEFGDALKMLAQKAGVELRRHDPKLQTERQRLLEICELACKLYEHQLEISENGKKAKEYLLGRGINEESIKLWRIGFSPDAWRGLLSFLQDRGYKNEEIAKAGLAIEKAKQDNFSVDPRLDPRSSPTTFQDKSFVKQTNQKVVGDKSASTVYDRFRGRIMFPIFDLNGQVVGFGGRVFLAKKEGEPKYINTPQTLIYDKSRILYGLNNAKVDIRQKNQCILVEGYTDVIMSHQAGVKNVVATSGTALTLWQLQILKRYSENLLTCFDMDPAGDTATRRGVDMAIERGFNVRVITFGGPIDGPKKDPADLIKENPQKWQEVIVSPKGIIEFYFERAFSKFDAKTPDGKKEIAKIILPVLKKIPSRIEQSHWIGEMACRLGAREEDIIEDLKNARPDSNVRQYEDGESSKTDPLKKKPKSRQETLEDRLLGLTLKEPEKSLTTLADFKFISPSAQEVFSHLKVQTAGIQDFNYQAFRASLPENLTSYLDNLILEEEFIGALDDLDLDQELRFCLRQIKICDLRKKLHDLEGEIKRLENEGKLEDSIFDEFNRLSRDLMMLGA